MHEPVMKEEVMTGLRLKKGDKVIDGTVGLGGHAQAILERISPEGELLAIDQDVSNLEQAKKKLGETNVMYVENNFEHLSSEAKNHGFDPCNAVFLDLGVSSPHLDLAERGFSFRFEGPLDMRMDQRRNPLTAEMILHSWPEEELARIFFEYGEERRSRMIARRICERRKEQPFTTTKELAEYIQEIKKEKSKRKHPAVLVFQALRIAVNRELDVLKEVLQQGIDLLQPQGRFAVLTYHSLEDRIVKHFFRSESKDCLCPPEILICQCHHIASVKRITRKSLTPSEEEIQKNPRSRSARLRIIEKI